ncbi:MAG: dinucleotide-utilizing protein [Flavobacteriaceae bacterium]|nr:MAG: dinucleotide-utilizing protein [Flavobacteriaceae bacterium]
MQEIKHRDFSIEEQQQYSRHLILDEIGTEGQLKLKNASVLVIGAGGLGCPVLQLIAAAGVGTIGMIDDDKVEQSNLQRQLLYTHQDLGKYKVAVAAKRLRGLNPYIQFETFTERLVPENAVALFAKYDIIVDGSDNFPTRYLVNDAAILAGKPLVFAAIFKFEGQVSVFNYKNGPTYRCLFPTPPEAHTMPSCSEIGVFSVLPGLIGALQANEVLKIICGIGTVLSGKLLTLNALTLEQYLFKFKKNQAHTVTALENNYGTFCGLLSDGIEISLAELKATKNSYLLLDVRTQEERDEFHIGGIHIPLDVLEQRFGEIDTDKEIVVYCKSGLRSKKAIHLLQGLGLDKMLINLKGGCF